MPDATRVDFYILAATTPASRLQFACRLAEKAYTLGHDVYAHTLPDEAEQLDSLLWTFRQGSFIPHAMVDVADERTPVKIGTPAAAQHEGELLINLWSDTPDFIANYKRVAEIVDSSEASKQSGRERFKRYRTMGFEPVTHNIE